ncbi:hypothetical protein EPD60_02145 [Flaviaesturariibacter flavus]|uniref:Gfo/Idh/MocA-like oxidoreductase N-terminal domain-containing protein n=1 Tax=Flaviaesturariibacter flavus TaxID=2502780 RepID=A0A4R1BNV2_9BACT|nr:Gfo/Idh/MocA family oxidoreductase [Flaviaesturariibacter flavus]TCJ19239.1 hypothetical protein EPD60_02145 [Flaviaesturariibacter flavus]
MYEIALIHDAAFPAALTAALPPDARVVAACPLSGASAPAGAATFNNIDELLAGSNAALVWVHTRTGYHAEYAIKALQAGRDVLCNAPLCITAAAAWQILETARYTRRNIWVAESPCIFWSQLREEIGPINRLHAWARSTGKESGNTFPDGGLLHTRFYGLAKALAGLTGPLSAAHEQLEPNADEERGGHAELHFGEDAVGYLDWSLTDAGSGHEPGCSVQVEGRNGKVTVSGGFAEDGTLLLKEVQAEGIKLTDPGQSADQHQNWISVLSGKKVAGWDAFEALRTVEFIDRIYGRVRKLS